MNGERFKAFCKETLPYLENMTEILKRYYPNGDIDMDICIDTSGYLRLRSSGTEWKLYRADFKTPPQIYLEHWEKLELPVHDV